MTNGYDDRNHDWGGQPNSFEEAASRKPLKAKMERFDNALKVYIKNLPLDDRAACNMVLEQFASCGVIQHHLFFEKKLAGQRIQQGLVVFTTEEEAEKATTLTGTEVGGQHIIVSKFRQFSQPSAKMVKITNLCVETNEEDLWNLFENCGTIKFIHIDRPLNSSSLKAEVHFKSEKCVRKALKLDGKSLKGNEICVSCLINEKEEQKPSKEYPVFVAGLPHDIRKEDLIKAFGDCGPIKRIKIIVKDVEEEGRAVIFFMDSESAENAVTCNGLEFSGYVPSVTQREEGMLQHQFLNPLFVAGLSRDTKDVDIFLKFQDCGLIHDIKFVASKPGSLKKCYIEFKEPESIEKAMAIEDLSVKGQTLFIGRTREIWSVQHTAPKPKKKKKKKTLDLDINNLVDEDLATPCSKKRKLQGVVEQITEDANESKLEADSPLEKKIKKKKKKKSADV
ncbi:Nucleolin [Frankliniella fusca]|uniref:Nucleolin n=1 Tax=Frankliniella fusca TaxID=407009 RepID=A0AAE1GR54_9NEOP|nr:Nucleolin [Frankliniella fusca]